jgi:two-component system, NarL family, sensor histidine kinase UhpB
MSLLWRVFAVNALVLVGAATALVLSPATVSFPVVLTEAVVLAVGLCVLLAINWLLLRRVFGPLRGLREVMARVDPLRPGARVEVDRADVEVRALAEGFNEMLGRLERERRDSGRRALAAQEEERCRIARELHDEVGQELTAAVLELDRAADGDEALAESREAVRATLLGVREIARRLRPEELDELGLASALTALCRDFGRRSGIAIERRFARDLPRLASDEELVVYRVAQESLTNVARHAAATTALVELEGEPDGVVTLRVRDDGRGTPAATTAGHGIRGMRERALLIGATLELRRPTGGGTEVELRLPSTGRRS